MTKEIKIVFAGLDFGGKSSIIKILKQKQSAFESSKPTRGIEHFTVNILDCCFNEWDLGGQEKYRKQYLDTKVPFYETDLFYYVIDISDSERFSETINYLKSIIEILKNQKPKPHIIILLNKNDRKEEIKEELVQNLQNAILTASKDFEIEFFRTTIFEAATLLHAFSDGINKISRKTSELNLQLKQMASETFADGLLLIENNGFILGEYAKDEISQKMCEIIYTYLISAFATMYNTVRKEEKPERIFIDWEDKGYAYLENTQIDKFEFFFISFSRNPRKIIQKFVLRSLINSSNQIKDIMKSYF